MRNRNLLNRKLDNLEATLTTLQHIVSTQSSVEIYKKNIISAQNLVEEIKDMVENEPLSPGEINKF